MNPGFDEGDFKKARGMLLSFSSLLIALWFFGADLKTVSLLGTKVAFTKNLQHVWLVALVANSYLMLRFYQHAPEVTYVDNTVYRRSFERCLITVMRHIKARAIRKDTSEHMTFLGHEVEGDVQPEIVKKGYRMVSNTAEKRRLTVGAGHIVTFHVRCSYRDKVSPEFRLLPAFEFSYPCPYWLVFFATYYARVIANLKTSHGTEYSLPYLWASIALTACAVNWLAANAYIL
ncbi:hypothetical protein [Pseudomonas syringae pv. coryli]|uniref:hypothetical protein n=1 Tax=Pseudomonas syringae pv. coryli TaxID=317659 RepID=UPI000698FBF9|nr:hypothetical protein [Pseudomonas syringae pv. coryli]